MRGFKNRCVWLVGLGLVISSGVGCQTTTTVQKTAPGALPGMTPTGPSTKGTAQINAATYFAHGHLLERQGAFEKAILQYQKAIDANSALFDAYNRMGITLNKLGRHEEASQAFREAIAVKPGMAHLHNNLGFSLYLEGEYATAAAELKRALEIKPDFPRAKMNYALALARLERFDQAYQTFTEICTQADALFNMGTLLTEAGRFAEARNYLEGALVANPEFEAARAQLAEVARLSAGQQPTPRVPVFVQPAPATLDPTFATNSQSDATAAPTATLQPMPRPMVITMTESAPVTPAAAKTPADVQPIDASAAPAPRTVHHGEPRPAQPVKPVSAQPAPIGDSLKIRSIAAEPATTGHVPISASPSADKANSPETTFNAPVPPSVMPATLDPSVAPGGNPSAPLSDEIGVEVIYLTGPQARTDLMRASEDVGSAPTTSGEITIAPDSTTDCEVEPSGTNATPSVAAADRSTAFTVSDSTPTPIAGPTPPSIQSRKDPAPTPTTGGGLRIRTIPTPAPATPPAAPPTNEKPSSTRADSGAADATVAADGTSEIIVLAGEPASTATETESPVDAITASDLSVVETQGLSGLMDRWMSVQASRTPSKMDASLTHMLREIHRDSRK